MYTPHHKRQPAPKPDRDWHDNATLWVAIFALIVAAVATGIGGWNGIVTQGQLEEMRAQRVLMEDQNRAMVEQNNALLAQQGIMESQQRPWLSVTATPADEFRFVADKKGPFAGLEINVQVKNVGQSVAVGVAIGAQAIAVPGFTDYFSAGDDEIEDRQKRLCDIMKTYQPANFMLFPNETTSQFVDVYVSAEDVARAKFGQRGESLAPVIIGCIDYRSPLSQVHHQTSFAYVLQRYIPDEFTTDQPTFYDPIPVGRTTARTSLRLVKTSRGNSRAD